MALYVYIYESLSPAAHAQLFSAACHMIGFDNNRGDQRALESEESEAGLGLDTERAGSNAQRPVHHWPTVPTREKAGVNDIPGEQSVVARHEVEAEDAREHQHQDRDQHHSRDDNCRTGEGEDGGGHREASSQSLGGCLGAHRGHRVGVAAILYWG